MDQADDDAPGDDPSVIDLRPVTAESRRLETYAQVKSPDDVPGGLYASHGAVTAHALATAAAGSDPRRRAYMRRMIAASLIIATGGSALVIAVAWLLD